MMKKARVSKYLKRRVPFREPRERILIVCEGAKTEPNYFNHLKRELKLHSTEVKVCGEECGTAPESLLAFAIEDDETERTFGIKEGYDKIWLVFDVENPRKIRLIKPVVGETKDKYSKVECAISNPCFEYWYIIHFKNIAPPFNNCNGAISELIKYYPSYDKSDNSILNEIFPRTQDAISNAESILKHRYGDAEIYECNPSTSVHILVKYLLEMSKKPY